MAQIDVGTAVRIVSGVHRGKEGVVEQLLTHSGQLLIRLSRGGLVTVDVTDVTIKPKPRNWLQW